MSLATFDEAASTYDVQLNQALAVTGEDKHYFAEQRIVHLARCLERMAFEAREVLDFGCGTGGTTPYFFQHLPTRSLCGLDVSKKSLEVAAVDYREYPASFVELAAYQPAEHVDLAYCNGVFHHIPIPRRAEALGLVWAALRPGGLFAFWENNPWNPGTRYIMSRAAFDRGANTISSIEAQRMLRKGGFRVLRTDFLFVFPAVLRRLRVLERHLAKLPLGGQYQVLCRKPAEGATAGRRTTREGGKPAGEGGRGRRECGFGIRTSTVGRPPSALPLAPSPPAPLPASGARGECLCPSLPASGARGEGLGSDYDEKPALEP